MKQLTVEEKVFLVIYSRSHNIDETMRMYGVSRATVTRYKKKYDGTEESLADKRMMIAMTVRRMLRPSNPWQKQCILRG